MRKRNLILFILLPLLASSCIEEFIPEIESQPYYLVVNGMVTDEHKSYTVNLGISLPMDKPAASVPARKAVVSVVDDRGTMFPFREVLAGVYRSDSTIFRGETGRYYTLIIVYKGKTYTSSPELMMPAPEIDTMVHEVHDREINAEGEKEQVVEVLLSTRDPQNNCKYYRWDFEETWEIRLPFNNLPESKHVCWASEKSHKILIANTEMLSESKVDRFPVTVFNNSTDRGLHRYSLIIRQYSMSREEYKYWEKLRKLTDESGGLYDIIPMPVTGNIVCETDPGEVVLGYFSTSGVTTRRIFIKSPILVPDHYTTYCVESEVPADYGIPGLNVFVWAIHMLQHGDDSLWWLLTTKKECTDCAYYGSNIKPYYWDEGFGL